MVTLTIYIVQLIPLAKLNSNSKEQHMANLSLFGLSQLYSLIFLASSALITVLLAIILIKNYWEEVSFFIARVRLGIPVFGRMKKLSKDIDSVSQKKWFFSEEDLCATFLPYYEKTIDMDKTYYRNCHGYMRKSQDLGIKPMSFFMWTLVIAMVIVEAFGFSYVLAGYTLPGASESLQQKGALGIAFLIATVLVFLTHHSGAEMRANTAIKKSRIWFNKSGDDGIFKPNNKVSLANDSADANDADYIQLLSRIKDVNANITPSWKISTMTLIFVIAVTVGSTYVRGKVLERDIIIESTGIAALNSATPTFGNPYAEDALPTGLTSAASEAERKASEDSIDTERKGGWATFLVLAVIFIFLQILGVLIGYKTSFAGRESKEAYKIVGRFKNERDFISYYKRKRDHIANTGQKYLAQLQKLMAQRSENTNVDGSSRQLIAQNNGRNFLAYADMVHTDTLQSERIRKEKVSAHNSALTRLDSISTNTDTTNTQTEQHKIEEDKRREKIRTKLLAQLEAEEAAKKINMLSDKEIEAQEMKKILAEQKNILSDEEIEAQEMEKLKGEQL